MFALEDTPRLVASATKSDLLVFSLISLAVLPEEGRQALFALGRQVRERGGLVAFDGNYRARLWPDKATAEAARNGAIEVSSIGLPTLEDEIALSGLRDAEEVARHWRDLGCDEVVVKLGSQGCRLPDGATLQPEAILAPVDTSGAGDAFNAGYLARRLAGNTPEESARFGHILAGWTIMRPGAIPARDADAPYA
jgi:2-dehydro-3-deoxygluconokinase